MKPNVILAFYCFILLASMQCNKTTTPITSTTQPNGLPLETQEGKNTFGCFWNDTLWLPLGDISRPGIYATYNIDSSFLDMSFYNPIQYRLIAITLRLSKEGTFEFTNNYPNVIDMSLYTDKIKRYRNSSNNNDTYINFTKLVKPQIINNKRIKGIVSGNFSLKLYKLNESGTSVDMNDSVIIKKAVFDLQVN